MESSGRYERSAWDMVVAIPRVIVLYHQGNHAEIGWHVRKDHKTTVQCCTGKVTVLVKGRKKAVDLSPGQSVSIPAGKQRAIYFLDVGTTFLETIIPAGENETADHTDIVFIMPDAEPCE